MSPFDIAMPAPRGLLYLACFNRQERAMIASDPELQSALRSANTSEWPAIFDGHTRARARRTLPCIVHHDRYVEAAINGVVGELAQALVGARNETLNKAAFRLGQLGIGEREAGVVLTATALEVGLCADEISRTIRSGVRAGAATPRERASA